MLHGWAGVDIFSRLGQTRCMEDGHGQHAVDEADAAHGVHAAASGALGGQMSACATMDTHLHASSKRSPVWEAAAAVPSFTHSPTSHPHLPTLSSFRKQLPGLGGSQPTTFAPAAHGVQLIKEAAARTVRLAADRMPTPAVRPTQPRAHSGVGAQARASLPGVAGEGEGASVWCGVVWCGVGFQTIGS
eukprot:358864-Chlamydomonas_euryale.AAC.3